MLFEDILPYLIESLSSSLHEVNYLIKGGQALKHHFEQKGYSGEARFSRDIDVAFESKSFPSQMEDFKTAFKESFDKRSKQFKIKAMELTKFPNDPDVYFGLRLDIQFGQLKADGSVGKKLFIKDLESLKVSVDLSCDEVVDSAEIEFVDDVIKYAKIPLIVAEKYRALCSNLHSEDATIRPRSKDFFDLFLIYAKYYQRNPDAKTIKEIQNLLNVCFKKKEMSLEYLKKLEDPSQKEFHGRNFQEQVLDTLSESSSFKSVTYDQVYSESLEFLDILIGSD